MNRSEIDAKLAEAKQKAIAAKAAAERARAKAKNPSPQYYEEPEYSGDLEGDAKAQIEAVDHALTKKRKEGVKKLQDRLDSEYWCALCFQTREQKEAFLAAIGVLVHGNKYLDGEVVAKALGVEIPIADVHFAKDYAGSRWDEFVG